MNINILTHTMSGLPVAVPAFHVSLPKYLMHDLEHVQKRAIMSIICPGVSYHEALVITSFNQLAAHHGEICESLFNNHRFYQLLPAPHESSYSLRRARPFNMPRFKTDCFKNSFIIND